MAELNSNTNTSTIKKVRVRKTAPKVDLTAMVDLAFLLITFFMLTTSMNKPNALDVAAPDKNMDEPLDMDERRIINLIVNENSYALIHGNINEPINVLKEIKLNSSELEQNLKSIKEQIYKNTSGKSAIVLIKPTIQSNIRGIINSLDETKSAGIKQYMLSKLTTQETVKLLTIQ